MHDPALTPLRWTFSWPVMRNSLIVGTVVGTILNMINQGDHLAGDGTVNWFKFGLTYCVPFCVATFGAFAAARIFAKQMRERREGGGGRTL